MPSWARGLSLGISRQVAPTKDSTLVDGCLSPRISRASRSIAVTKLLLARLRADVAFGLAGRAGIILHAPLVLVGAVLACSLRLRRHVRGNQAQERQHHDCSPSHHDFPGLATNLILWPAHTDRAPHGCGRKSAKMCWRNLDIFVHAQSPRQTECCAALGRKPSNGETAFPSY